MSVKSIGYSNYREGVSIEGAIASSLGGYHLVTAQAPDGH